MEDTSLFLEFMGDAPVTRVLDYLLTERELDFSITDLADNAKIGRATLYRIWNNLKKSNILVHTRVIGKAKLFKLNTADKNIQKLIELYDQLTVEEVRKRVKRKINIIQH